ncbi:unnamed protein product [Oncorhynchus mykiss]|uniref:Uncharacterized protein n=1 Tax=Oncorhynchus mykiss TaxID=8022 RepID=A0A060Y278_ONCMY|nr:unnamed protein product [Oncorhynchus mykiss]
MIASDTFKTTNMKLHQILRNAANFRTVFDFGDREVAHWFPRHMAKGLKQMKASVKNVDCILEIHDARISFKGRLLFLIWCFSSMLIKKCLAALTEGKREFS